MLLALSACGRLAGKQCADRQRIPARFHENVAADGAQCVDTACRQLLWKIGKHKQMQRLELTKRA